MSRGGVADRHAVRGAHAWAYLRRDPGYRAAWAALGEAPCFEEAEIPVRLQSEADLLAAADWSLLAWEDPQSETWRSPFWPGVPMLVGEPDPAPWPEPAPLLGLLAGAGARVEGLRMLYGRFVLKAELGNALLQILVPSGRAFGPDDEIMAKQPPARRPAPKRACARRGVGGCVEVRINGGHRCGAVTIHGAGDDSERRVGV